MRAAVTSRLAIDQGGRLTQISVYNAEGSFLGRWEPGYRDVSAADFRTKDSVRAEVQRALGAFVMQRGNC